MTGWLNVALPLDYSHQDASKKWLSEFTETLSPKHFSYVGIWGAAFEHFCSSLKSTIRQAHHTVIGLVCDGEKVYRQLNLSLMLFLFIIYITNLSLFDRNTMEPLSVQKCALLSQFGQFISLDPLYDRTATNLAFRCDQMTLCMN